jgi:hypothetical protein
MTLLQLDPDDRDLMRRAVAALETIAATLSTVLGDEPEPDEPDDDLDEPDEVAPWAPRVGALATFAGELVSVDRLFETEGTTGAEIETEDGTRVTVWARHLSAPL